MGCLFPQAEDLARYWANIRTGVDAITEVPDIPLAVDGLLRRRPEGARPDLRPPRRLPRARSTSRCWTSGSPRTPSRRPTRPSCSASWWPARPSTTPATATGRDVRPRPRQRHPRRHRHARAGDPAGRPARPPDLAARARGGRRRRADRRRRRPAHLRVLRRLAGELVPRPARQRRRRPDRQPARPAAAPTASSTPPAPARSAPSTSRCSSWPPAAATSPSPAGSIRSTTSSCICASARRRPCRRRATRGRSTRRPTARSWARGWASWC